MKNKVSLFLGGLFIFCQAGTVLASTTFTMSATVPQATGISIVVDSVNATGSPIFSLVSGSTLSFNSGGGMTYNAANNIFLPSVYYALNIQATGGAGLPDTTVTYSEGNNPNSGSTAFGGLGTKATATFAQELGSTESITALGKKRLIDLTGNVGHEPYTALAPGSYLRVYVGIWTGSSTSPADPSNGQPFSYGDAPGQYSGALTVSATVN